MHLRGPTVETVPPQEPVSETPAPDSEKQDVRFKPEAPKSQSLTPLTDEDLGHPTCQPLTLRRPRQSLLLFDMLEDTLQPRLSLLNDESINRTDEMIRDIVQDTIIANTMRGESFMNLSKIGIKLPIHEYSGGDTLEGFITFTKAVTKYLGLYNLLRPEHRSYHTDLLGQMLKGKALIWFNQVIGPNIDLTVSLIDTLVALK